MTFIDDLLAVTLSEWKRWGYSARPIGASSKIGGKEKIPPYVSYVNDYWRAVGHPSWNGNTPQPWSAAFISFCFKTAGAGNAFPYDQGHAGYCAAILRSPATFSKLRIADPASTTVDIGDVLWAARSGDGCKPPPKTHQEAVLALTSGGWFCSHCDIVVEMRQGEIDAIGGNISDSVTKTTFASQAGKITDPRNDWLGVIKNGI